jgi:hypothetical protein
MPWCAAEASRAMLRVLMTRSTLVAVTLAPTPHLLGAALAGLLCLAGCSNSDEPGTPGAAGDSSHAGSAGHGSESEGGTAAGGDSASAGSSSNGGDASAAGASAGGVGSAGEAAAGGVPNAGGAGGAGGSAGAGGAADLPPHITSSENVGVMTEEQFKALCDERGGTVEVMPHCGGFATGPGFSYDNGTLLLSEHTCAGANTCGGWNCVVPEE